MLPVTTVTRPPVACYALQCYSTKVRFWHVTKLKLPILAGNFQKKCYKVPVKSVTRGGYTQLLLLHLLLRGGRGGSPVLQLQSVTNWGGGAKKLALQSVTKGGVTALSEGYVIYGRRLMTA